MVSLKYMRLIGLCNVSYKVHTKILVHHLKSSMDELGDQINVGLFHKGKPTIISSSIRRSYTA